MTKQAGVCESVCALFLRGFYVRLHLHDASLAVMDNQTIDVPAMSTSAPRSSGMSLIATGPPATTAFMETAETMDALAMAASPTVSVSDSPIASGIDHAQKFMPLTQMQSCINQDTEPSSNCECELLALAAELRYGSSWCTKMAT